MAVEVVDLNQALAFEGRLRGCHLDAPRPGHAAGATVEIYGWALDSRGPAVAAELTCAGVVVQRLQMRHHRPDLAAAYPDDPDAAAAGFRGTLPVPAGTAECEYKVRAVLRDQTRAAIGSVRLRRTGGPGEPLVSVVIPCYRQARYLGAAIESALGQTHGVVEIVVVDDGSPDNTAAVAARYPGVRYLRQNNRGLSAARNAGLRHSTGEYVVFLDADDRLLANAIEAGVRSLADRPGVAFTSGQYRTITEVGTPLADPGRNLIAGDHYVEFLRGNYIGMLATVLFRGDLIRGMGGFNEKLRSCEDYDLFLRIAREHPVQCHGTVVAEYRQHSANMSLRTHRMLRYAVRVLRSQRQFLGSDPLSREAYWRGLHDWRNLYGEPLLAQVAAENASPQERVRSLIALLRYDPRRAASFFGTSNPSSDEPSDCFSGAVNRE